EIRFMPSLSTDRALHKKSRAVIDRPYSLRFPTVGALYERPQFLFCAKPTGIVAASLLLLSCWCVSAAAQGATDISGMWIVQDPGSGNWSDWYNNVPKPSLRPEIIKDNEAIATREARGEVVNRAARLASCPFGNLPMMMASSPPLNIVQSRE